MLIVSESSIISKAMLVKQREEVHEHELEMKMRRGRGRGDGIEERGHTGVAKVLNPPGLCVTKNDGDRVSKRPTRYLPTTFS